MRRLLLPLTLAGALCLSAPATAAAPAKFKGKTSQNRTVTFTVKGGKVTAFSAGINMGCVQSGIELNAVIPPKALKVKGGKFSYKGRDATDGTNIVINGTVRGKSANGSIRMTDSRYNAVEQNFDSCVGSAKFTANAR